MMVVVDDVVKRCPCREESRRLLDSARESNLSMMMKVVGVKVLVSLVLNKRTLAQRALTNPSRALKFSLTLTLRA